MTTIFTFNRFFLWIFNNNPCMESIIQKVDFLKNENCIFSFFKFWNMDLNLIFVLFFKYEFLFQFEFQLKLKQNLNLWNLLVTSKSFCLIVRCLLCIMSDLIQWLLLWKMTLRQAKWTVGKVTVEMFQRRQHDYRPIDGCFHKNSEVHVSRSFSN